ncbi:hypothetical protein BHYA_0046g00430 [Botrytis hyacinthi]|uniref:Uncharacterized protein n=1 Tax=Botrytis hyacinthi TaxID=278943 RepID=A0A4Z1GW53_9HELO|nr:hypothetical protein BHYA_0046g00430 [Botrytis hyacinthi]
MQGKSDQTPYFTRQAHLIQLSIAALLTGQPVIIISTQKSQQNSSLFSACRNFFAELGCLPTRRDPDPIDEYSDGTVSAEYSVSVCPVSSIAISDVGGVGNTSIPNITEMGNVAPMTSISDVKGMGNPVPISSIPEIAVIRDPTTIENNDTNTFNETSPAEGETNQFEDLCLTQPLRLIEQRDVQLENLHDSSVSVTSYSLPPLPLVNFTHSFLATVPPTVPHPVLTTVFTTFPTIIPNTMGNAVPITVNTTVPTTVETTVETTVDESNLSPPDDKQLFLSITEETTVDTTLDTTVDESNLPPTNEQPSFPYKIYDFTKSGLVVSEISGINVEDQYHQIMKIVGEACGKCSKCTSDNRAQGLIDTIIEIRFPDLDSALFRDGILSEFGFDDYWNEFMVTKLEVRKRYEKYENWYAKVWEDIEANNDLPAISKGIEKEFGQSRDLRRILAGKKHPKCRWRKRELLLFVMRMRRIRGKLEQRPQKQEKQETQTIETSAKKNRKTRDQEKRRKLREREDKVAAKLLHDTFEDIKRIAGETDTWEIMMAWRESTSLKKVCTPENVYSGWEERLVLLLFIDIQKFVSRVKLSEDPTEIRCKRVGNIHQGPSQGTAEILA